MATHHPTPPLGGGERPRLAARHYSCPEQCSGGPVTQAIRAMRSAEQTILVGNDFGLGADLRSDHTLSRTEVEDLIGGLIDLLDAMDGDTDREPEVSYASDAEWSASGAHCFNLGEAA